ncbi:MAG TPA: hypothetical protein IAB35_01000 [Candidatus Faecimonas gallistercoris]|nr:hypothetical protein [Candidatus Faecimonas gallistercoris]
MKKNNKGFVLVETLVVTVFVMAVFSVIYVNFYPLVGEYERREFYDDVDSKYGAYWIKRFIQSSSYDFYRSGGLNANITSNGYANFQCSELGSEDRNFCSEMWSRLGINKVVVTTYNIQTFKDKIQSNSTGFTENFVSYIEYLPNFEVASENGAKFRVLVEFKQTSEDEEYYSYANMEVVK